MELKNPFSPGNVCRALINRGYLSKNRARMIIENYENLRQKLAKRPAQILIQGQNVQQPSITAMDVIASLNLDRKDDPRKKLDEETIYQALAQEWKVPYKKIDPLKLDLNLVTTIIPRSFALKHLVVPVEVKDGELTVATPNPFNMEALDDIARVSPMKVRSVVSSKTDIIKIINEFFGFKKSIAAAEDQFSGPAVDLGNLEQYVQMTPGDASDDSHIINAVNHLLAYGIDQRASDIHIEPKRDISLVRMRIDGVLHNVHRLPKKVHSAIVTRIKGMSRLDMAEKRRPQDGRVKMDKGDAEVEIRVSIIPVAFGEKVVMRIMDPDILFQDLKHLGFSPADLVRYTKCIKMPHGIVLVCGPTGSGKSTTLYSTLRELSSPEINITTVEDPIEMVDENFNQIAVQPSIGITFASILRNILRQDPDIIMIGEMRDLETAENAIQAALTGHLVLSTLHTNDAPASLTRLLDLGVPAFLIQSTLVGIIAQRLVRKICPNCVETFEMETAKLKAMGLDVGKAGKNGKVVLSRGAGCLQCRGTGYKGRMGVFEVMPYSDGLKRITTADTDLEAIRQLAQKEGMVTMRENAIKKLLAGETTYEEVLRVTWEQR